MTDKQIIETLKNIKHYCEFVKTCEECKFYKLDEYADCQIYRITKALSYSPTDWDMEELEGIIKQ